MSKERLVVSVAASPRPSSRSTAILRALGSRLESSGIGFLVYTLAQFDAADVLLGKIEGPSIQTFLADVKRASAVVFSTPVYKATYAGSLKVIIDLIEPSGLAGKSVLAIATARVDSHLSLVDEGFRRLYDFFIDSRALPTVGLTDAQLGSPGGFSPDESAERALDGAAQAIAARLG